MAQRPIVMNGTRLAVNDDGSLAVANADGSPIAGGSTTVGNVAVATAAAPAYVEGATVPLSVDLAGTLRSTGGSGGGTSSTVDVTDRTGRLVGHVTVDNLPATQPVSGTVTANAGTGVFDVTPATPAANDYLPVRLTDGTAFYAATGGGGGGGAATIADGADVAQGTTTDTAWTTGAGTVIGLLKAAVNAIKGTLTADITDRAARLLGHVTVDNASIPVTGTFWQATQPVSGTVTANLGTVDGLALDTTLTGGTQKAIPRGAAKGTTAAGDVTSAAVDANTQAMHVQLAGTQPTIPVSGTFWQATQPISGTIGVSNAFALDATLGTTNTDLGGLTETAPSTDTGSSGLNGRLQRVAQRLTSLIGQIPATLGQKTMANSLAVTVASDQSGVPVTGTFWQATQPVSGTVTANQGAANATPWNEQVYCGDSTGAAAAVGFGAGQKNMPVQLNNVATSAASTAPTATQQALVVSLSPNVAAAGNVREVKDANRTAVLLFASAVASVTTEAMISLTISSAAGAVTTGTSYTVPAGKTLRVQSVHAGTNFATMSTTVTFANNSLRIRAGNAVTSNLMYQTRLDAASNFPGATEEIDLPDGWELPAGTVIGISQLGSATTLVTDIALIGFLY